MDRKHAMLYPPIEETTYGSRASASASIGLPTEQPPSYDMAIGSGPTTSRATTGWNQPTAPAMSPPITAQPQPHLSPFPHTDLPRTEVMSQPVMPHMRQVPHQQPQQQLPAAPVVTVSATMPLKLGPNPCAVTCPTCGTCRTTRMSYTPNSRTHLCALVLCIVGWCCCACWVPYCMKSCRTGNHYCSKCNTFLGTFDPRQNR